VTNILVIDEHEESRSFVRTVLGGAGYAVYEACDGHAAVACCQVHAIDVVITDILLPEPGSLETIRALRTRHHPAKIIAMAARSHRALGHLLEMSLLVGADRTVQKPLQPSTLLLTVQTLLAGT
jgi:CheY-like chemotaxis protein